MSRPKAQFWAFLTHEDEKTYERASAYTLRVSSEKHVDPQDACKSCFGCVLSTLLAKPLGANVAVMRVDSRRRAALTTPTASAPNGWRTFPWTTDAQVLPAGKPILAPR